MVKSKKVAKVDLSHCVACGVCMMVCPKGAVYIERGGNSEVDEEMCIGCGKCEKNCPTGAIKTEFRTV